MSQTAMPNQIKHIEESIQSYIDELGLPESASHQAIQLYKLSYKKDLYRGRPINSVLGTSVYIASLLIDDPRPPSRICNVFEIEEQELFNTYRHFKKKLDIPVPIANPYAYITQITTELELSDETIERAEYILEETKNHGNISGKSATGLAAAAIYLAATKTNDSVTQKELSEIVGVTEVTIRNRYQNQKELIDSLENSNSN